MAEGKYTDGLFRLRCTVCKEYNYYIHKNKKAVTRKLEYQKYCKHCRKKTVHKEAKK